MPCYPPDEQKRRDAQIEKLIARGILTPEGMLATILHGDDVDRERLEMLISHRFYTWEPRPDDPDDHEEQTAFVEDNTSSLAICLGGTGCLAAEQLVYVHGLGMVPVAEIDGPFVTKSWNARERRECLAMANGPFVKGLADLYEFRLSDGRAFRATKHHRVLTATGQWVTCGDALSRRLPLFDASRHPSNSGTCPSESRPGESRSSRTSRDCPGDCSPDRRPDGERLRSALAACLSPARQSTDVRGHSRHCSRRDGRACESGCSRPCPQSGRHATPGSLHLGTSQLAAWQTDVFCKPSKRVSDSDPVFRQCRSRISRLFRTIRASVQPATRFGSKLPYKTPLGGNELGDTAHVHIATCERIASNRPFYDFTVHGTHCYVIDGIVHHNSGKTDAAAYKTAKYLKEKPPHRERCPFWVIGEKFDQVTNVCWNEKLSRLIDERDIADIRWLDSKLKRPRSVLLKHPTLAGKIGWVIEFKSYEQGIGSMKAESIGGFWANEEIAYSLILEIMGRCRDYNSPGWADFTPIECRDAAWPEAYDSPPEGFKFFHLNTMRNPYISEDWKRTFFATVPEDMRELRTIGRFTSLAGQVYKEFRKKTHVIEPFNIPRDWRKYRGIDFGFNNYFACLWVAQDHDGRYYVYDEHYRNQTLIRDHAREINKRVWATAGEEPYYCQTFSDHDPQVRSELSQYGIGCTPASKDVNAGIECVRGKMIIQGDGKPQLFIFDKCVNLIREILGYRYPEGGSIRSPSDEPMKVDDHAVDALRYVIYSSRTRSIAAQASGWKAHVDGKKHGVFGGRRAA